MTWGWKQQSEEKNKKSCQPSETTVSEADEGVSTDTDERQEFDQNGSKWTTCCGCHVATLTFVWGTVCMLVAILIGIYLVVLLLTLSRPTPSMSISHKSSSASRVHGPTNSEKTDIIYQSEYLYNSQRYEYQRRMLVLGILYIIFGIFVIAGLICAVRFRRWALMLPYLVMHGFAIFLNLLATLGTFSLIRPFLSATDDYLTPFMLIMFCFIYLLLSLLNGFVFSVCIRCCTYLRAQQIAVESQIERCQNISRVPLYEVKGRPMSLDVLQLDINRAVDWHTT